MKLEFNSKKILYNLILKSYFKDGQNGKLNGKDNYIEIDQKKDKEIYSSLTGLHNDMIRVYNNEIIDGNWKFIVDESKNKIRLYPISLFCIKENDKYSFY